MSARDVEQLGRRLTDLNEQAISQLALAWVAFGLAVAAGELRHDLALPLFVGALVLTGLGLGAFVKHTLLVEDAAEDRDAYTIEPVRRYAARIAKPARRRQEAVSVRHLAERLEPNRDALLLLADELEGDAFDPFIAVEVEHLVHAAEELSPAELRFRLSHVQACLKRA